MNRTLALPDGTRLDLNGDDPLVGIDSDTTRTARWDAAESVLRDSDGNVIRKVPTAPRRPKTEPTKAPRRAAGDTAVGDRFATLNTFVDQVMQHLSPVEAKVWLVMYRDCRNGQCSESNRDLARRTGCSLRAVGDAVQRLRKVRLISVLKLSACKGQASLYAVESHPENCLPALLTERKDGSATGADFAPVDIVNVSEPVQQMHRMAK